MYIYTYIHISVYRTICISFYIAKVIERATTVAVHMYIYICVFIYEDVYIYIHTFSLYMHAYMCSIQAWQPLYAVHGCMGLCCKETSHTDIGEYIYRYVTCL